MQEAELIRGAKALALGAVLGVVLALFSRLRSRAG